MDINTTIIEVKKHLKNITSHFPYSEYELNIFTIIYIAMASIDNDIIDLLDETFTRVFILINPNYDNPNLELNQVIQKYDENINLYYAELIPPTITNEKNYQNSFIVINLNKNKPLSDLLDSIIHELKHSINSIINSFMPGKTAFYRVGLETQTFVNNRLILTINAYIEETFNSYLSKIYLEAIQGLKSLPITNPEILAILDEFSLKDYQYSYNAITHLLIPLFQNQILFPLFYNAALYKDYSPLQFEIERIFDTSIYDMPIEYPALEYLNQFLTRIRTGEEINIEHLEKIVEGYIEEKIFNYPYQELSIKSNYKFKI